MKKPIPKEAQATVIRLFMARQQAELVLTHYVNGLKEGMGLKGLWNLNTKDMTFEQKEEEE